MEIDFENIGTICRICLQCKQPNSLHHEMEINADMYEFSSIYSSITIDSRTISLIDIMALCLSHKLSDDKEISQMICNLCVRRLSDCWELKYQIEQSEQLLLSVVSSRLFVGLSNEYSDSNDQSLSKSHSLIDTISSVVNDFECSLAVNEIFAGQSLREEVTAHIQESVTQVEDKDVSTEKRSRSRSAVNCLICSKKFSTSSKLDRHSVNQHLVRNDVNVYKPHQCEECPKSYTTKANLVLHRAVHSGIKPFICETCHRGFYKKTSLSTHMAIHTGIRKHLCTDCGRSFTSANILQQHKRTHSDVRRFVCSVCSKGFHTSNDLRVHFRSHSGERPYLCSHCGRRFSRVTHLNIHLRTHSGEKPYCCQQCPKAFAQSGDLKAHERIHNGEKPYACKICHKRFVKCIRHRLEKGTNVQIGEGYSAPDAICNIISDRYFKVLLDDKFSSLKKLNNGLPQGSVLACVLFNLYITTCQHPNPEFELPRKAWKNLNRLRTGHGRCNDLLFRWNYFDDPAGQCGYPRQTTYHILNDCPDLSYDGQLQFNQSSGLGSHMKSHTNERNYVCFCGKSFTQSSSLARHGKLHRKVEQTDVKI